MVTEATTTNPRVDADEFIDRVEIVRVPANWSPATAFDIPPQFCEVVDTVEGDFGYIQSYNRMSIDHGGKTWARPIPKAASVAEMRRLTDGAVVVQFAQFTSLEGDPDAQGHLYVGYLENHEAADITLDDRRDESLPQQLVDELRRVAEFYGDLAEQAAARLAETARGESEVVA